MPRFAALLITALLAFSIVTPRASAQDKPFKVGLVDMQHVFDNYYVTLLANQNRQKQRDSFRVYLEGQKKEIEDKQAMLKTMTDESLDPILSDEGRQKKKTQMQLLDMEIRDKRAAFVSYSQEKTKEMMVSFEKKREEILVTLNTVIGEISTERGYALVLDLSGYTTNKISPVVYFNPDDNITEVLLAKLNAGQEENVKMMLQEQEELEKKAKLERDRREAAGAGAANR